MTEPRRPTGSGGRDEHREVRRDRVAVGRVTPWRRTATLTGVDDVDGAFDVAEGGELLGWSAVELRCAPYREWLHPDDRDLFVEVGEAVRDEDGVGRFWPVEVRILSRDRHYWWTRWQLRASSNRSAVWALGVDYVDRGDVVGPPVGTWRWDMDTDVVVWSAELLDMFALTVGPPASYDEFLASVDDEDRASVDGAVRWSVLSGEPYVADFRAGHTDGRDRWFHAAGRLEPAAGDRVGQLCGIVKYLNPPDDTVP